jgi:hypothetical protein
MSKLVSGRVKKLPQSGITSDRYEFLGLDQAEPDLGDPVVGPSSIGVNPYTGNISETYVLISDSQGDGNRYWAPQPNVISGGIVNPGSITVRDSGVIVGSVNQITDINFVGSGVTVTSPASWVGSGSSSVDITVAVIDVEVPSGKTGSIGYRDGNSLLQGADDFIYNPVNKNVGIGSTTPKVKLDVLGDANISGILTVNQLKADSAEITNSLKVGNFEIVDNTTFIRIISGSVGVGTTNPIATLDVRGTVNVSGAATFANITAQDVNLDDLTANRITTGYIFSTSGFIGILTSNTINSGNLISTSISATNSSITNLTSVAATVTNFIGTSVTVTGNLQVNNNTLFANSSTTNVGFGTTNPVQKVQVGPSTNPVVITDSSRIGIGTTNPDYNLDVRGNVGFSSFIFINGSSGLANQVLVSGGTGLPFWGAPENITVGAAVSVSIASTQQNDIFYPTFTRQTVNNAIIRVDSTGLVFNPALNYLGIGTTAPTSNLDVVGDIKTNSLSIGIGTTVVNASSNVVSTATTATAVLSSLNTGVFRSARYNVQITCNGQLVANNSSASVSNLQGGSNYLFGIYPNVLLTTSSGSGSDARADIQVTPEKVLPIDSISSGSFNVQDTIGVNVNAPVSFNRLIPATPRENSRVTSITVVNSGAGYTALPSIQIAAPTNNPPILGVTGSGTTATAVVDSLFVSDVSITTPGIHTTIPTVSFKTPVGAGASATGLVGVGVSRVTVTNSGFGYNIFPTVNAESLEAPLEFASLGISTVFLTNFYVQNTGLGYTSSNFPILTIGSPEVGVNTATAVVNSLGVSIHFTITPGLGYTTPPTLTASSPNVGVNTATLTATLGISSITITSPGAGYTSSSQIQISSSPTVTGFAATVGLGVTLTDAIISGGVNYATLPTVTFSAPNVSSGTTATGGFTQLQGDTGVLGGFQITNPGSGYFSIPTVTVSGGGGTGAGVTITTMRVANVVINNTGFGVTVVPSISIISPVGGGVAGIASMGIGRVNVVGFGSGYNLPPTVTVTLVGSSGAGASVVAGLGVTSSNITITNPGYGYSSIPTVTVSSPTPVSIASSIIAGVGITGIVVNNSGIGYSGSTPTINITSRGNNFGSGAVAIASSLIVTNVYITNPGSGYTASDLASLPIATFSPTGTAATVGFGVSTILLTNLGVGYTSAVAAAVSFSAPNISTGTTATATASLGFPGILPGPGVNTTGQTRIYYVASVSPNSIGISTGVGIGTLTAIDVGDDVFTSEPPIASIGGTVTNVLVVSPGSGYTSTSVLTASSFDGANTGTGFSFRSSTVVNNYQFSDVMILQSVGSASTSCDFMEYGTIANDDIIGSFNADISGPNARLLFTPTYRNNIIKISSQSITN